METRRRSSKSKGPLDVATGNDGGSANRKLRQQNSLNRRDTLNKLQRTEDNLSKSYPTSGLKSEMAHVVKIGNPPSGTGRPSYKRSYSLQSVIGSKEMDDAIQWKTERSGSRPSSRIKHSRRRSIRKLRALGMFRRTSFMGFGGNAPLPDIIDIEKLKAKKEKARQRFIHAVRMVVIVQRALSFILKRHKGRQSREIMSFTEIANDLENETYTRTSGLSFDPREYRAKKEVHMSNEVKHILSLPSSARTPDQLQTALYGLQTIRSFVEYPLHMQEKLVKVAWFETIPPKRVIIRQGHYAENFYFIVSGSVVVTIMDSKSGGDGLARTAAVLRKGSSFGELALLHRSKRTATVSSQGLVQLLCIGREDFFDIFMRGQQPGQEPQHIQYLRKLAFMKYWPIEKFIEHPEMCLFHFYKRGQVMVKDSNNSDWIYIVMSGTCQVLRQLKAATPQMASFEVHLPRLNVDKRNTRLRKRKSGRKRSNTTVADYQYLGVPTLYDDVKTSEFQRLMSEDLPLPHTTLIPRRRSRIPSDVVEEKESEPWSLTQADDSTRPETNANILPEIPDLRKGATPRPSYSRSKYKEIAELNGSCISNMSQNESQVPHVIMPRDNSANSYGSRTPQPTQNDISVFVQIELLQRRDVFGLSTLNMDMGIDHEQASVSLVSNGAECIMIKKDFFVKYCSDIVRRNIRALIRPYPPTTTLQHNLQSHADWSHYKEDKVKDLIHNITRLKELKF